MSASNSFENELLLHYFNNATMPNVGDATGLRGSTTAGSLYVALHTADPGEAGTQATSETAYGSYARVATTRSGAGWTVTTNTVSNAAAVTFPTVTSTSGTFTYFSIGRQSAGATVMDFSAALLNPLAFDVGTIPNFPIGSLIIQCD